MQIITLPVPDELLSIVDNSTECELLKEYTIDISSIKYDDPDLEKNKVECSLIYLRNVDLPLPCDFSGLKYKEKEEWVVKYINADLFDLTIRELNETILNILADTPINNTINIFTEEETTLFKQTHTALIHDILQLIVSLRVLFNYAITKDKDTFESVDLNLNLPIIEEKPLFFEMVHQLLKYYPTIFEAITLYYSEKIQQVEYKYIWHKLEQNSILYMDYLNLPSMKFLGLLLDKLNTKEEQNDTK